MNQGYIDIHYHLVYGIDDGAQSVKEARRMAELSWRSGAAAIVCTSHITPGVMQFPLEKYRMRLHELRAAVNQMEMELSLLSGSEVLFTPLAPKFLCEKRILTLAGTDYVLIEFEPGIQYTALCEALASILRVGYLPVVAHVERYPCLSPQRAQTLKRELADVLFQMNSSSVLGGKGFFADLRARRLLDCGAIDIIASDAHNCRDRRPRMREAYRELSRRYGSSYAARAIGLKKDTEFWRAVQAAMANDRQT